MPPEPTHHASSRAPRAAATLLAASALALAACGGMADTHSDASSRDGDASARADGASVDGASADGSPATDAAPDGSTTTIRVENLADGAELPHDLIVLRGSVAGASPSSIELRFDGHARSWPVVAGQFKAVEILHAGANDVTLAAGGGTLTLHLTYTPQTNPLQVRFLYAEASDGDGSFDAPPGMPNTPADAQTRIALIARMFQAFTAETQVRDGFGRRTFNLQRDAQGEPVVTVYRTRMSTTAARAMTDIQLWNELYTELGTLPNRDNFIDVVFLGMSHWDPATQRLLAHGALGGGRLAMFGGSGLYTWATSLDDLVAHWSDTRMVPLGDDSAGRGTYWANFSTTGFAALHELGHCLSLPHTTEGTKIMNRGFDIMDRTFMPYEPPNLTTPLTLEQEAGWDRSAAVRLGFHRFLDLTARTYASDTAPTIAFASNTLTIASEQGIRHVAYSWDGYVRTHDEFLATPPPSVTLTAAALRARLPAETPHPAMVDVNAIDAAGNIYSTTVSLP